MTRHPLSTRWSPCPVCICVRACLETKPLSKKYATLADSMSVSDMAGASTTARVAAKFHPATWNLIMLTPGMVAADGGHVQGVVQYNLAMVLVMMTTALITLHAAPPSPRPRSGHAGSTLRQRGCAGWGSTLCFLQLIAIVTGTASCLWQQRCTAAPPCMCTWCQALGPRDLEIDALTCHHSQRAPCVHLCLALLHAGQAGNARTYACTTRNGIASLAQSERSGPCHVLGGAT